MTLETAQERIDHPPIELQSRHVRELFACGGMGHRGPVRTVVGHRLVCRSDGDDPPAERNLRPLEAVGIALAVGALVMVENPLADVVETGSLEDVSSDLGMPSNRFPFVFGERSLSLEDGARDTDLSDVVQDAGEANALDHV